MRLIWIVLISAGMAGCATSHDILISTRPADAQISVDGLPRGRAPLTETFKFNNDTDTHSVTASRLGYKDQTVRVTKDFETPDLEIELKPRTRRVTFTVLPLPGVISVDGKPLSPDPVTQTSAELEFTVDAKNQWTSHVVSADRPGFKKIEQKVLWTDPSGDYVLNLDVLRKDLSITTTPAGATVTINGETLGISPVTFAGWPFPVKPDTGEGIPQKVHATRPGYDPADLAIGWDDGKAAYHLDLPVKSKVVRLISYPAGAVIKIDGVDVKQDAAGVATARLSFAPTDDKGTLRTYSVSAVRAASETLWEPLQFVLHWDEGKTDYTLPLKEIKRRDVELLVAKPTFSDQGWSFVPQRIKTIGMKDVAEPGDKDLLTRLTDLPKGSMIDTLTVSPDGSQVLLTTLTSNAPTELTSTMLSVRTDGTGVTTVFSDGKSLDLTPSYTPDGTQIVFASNRGGRRLSVWEMSAAGDPGITQLTSGDESDLWPVVDSDPRPRLFYESLVDTRSDPRIYMTQLGATTRTDLTRAGGMQPRVSPKGDSILFTAVNQKTGKRQIYRMPDRGGVPVTLSNPEADEFDAAWSLDGTRIAYVSDRGTDEENRNNFDVWILDLSHPEKPIRVTHNGSWDDSPAWDPLGRFICFRSNRGGQWGAWKITLK